MAVIAFDFPAAQAAHETGRFETLRARFAAWRLYRRTVRELSELSNADLADIGIGRSAIRSVAWHAVYG